MRLRWSVLVLPVVMVWLVAVPGWCVDHVDTLIEEMMTAYTRGTQGVNTPEFKTKVNELDEELRVRLEKDHDVKAFEKLLASAEEFSSRKAARIMFSVALERAAKRLQFTKAQQEIKDANLLARIDEMKTKVDAYLDPNKADEETVNRSSLEAKQAAIKAKMKQVVASFAKNPQNKKYVVNTTDDKGQPSKLPGALEKNLIEKLKSLTPNARQIVANVQMKSGDQLDLKIQVYDYSTPGGFGVQEATLEFDGVAMAALKDARATEYAGLFDDTTFARYRVVQTEQQLNVIPNPGETAYEMGSLRPGDSWKMEFAKADAIDAVMKELSGDDRFQIPNADKAKQQKCIVIKNTGAKDLIYLQGTDKGGLCSVKALGYLQPKAGTLNFKEQLLVVDDQLASDLGKFIGREGINFFLKVAWEQNRKGYPFTPVLEGLQFDRDGEGRQVFIFTGRGPRSGS